MRLHTSASLILAATLSGCYGQYSSTESDTLPTQKAPLAERYKAAVIQSARVANIAAIMMSNKNQIYLDDVEMQHVVDMSTVINDRLEQTNNLYHKQMRLRGVNTAFTRTDFGYMYDGEWKVEVTKGSPYYANPPISLNTAFHNEVVSYPKCNQGEKPTIMVAEAYRAPVNATSGLDIIAGQAGYIIRFKSMSDIDDMAKNRMVLFDLGCQTVKTSQ